jgi:hypothetical protein
MTDQMQETTPTRVFKIGSVRIVEDESMQGKSSKEIQKMLAPLYPQIENATIREHTDEASGVVEVSYLPAAGRKG